MILIKRLDYINSIYENGSCVWSILTKTIGKNTTTNTDIQISASEGVVSFKNSNPSKYSSNTVNIVRGQTTITTTTDKLTYYAEYPINTVYTNDINHRIKIRPKTGFKYVKYS